MNIEFQHLNAHQSHDSTAIYIETRTDSAVYLIDAGGGLDLSRLWCEPSDIDGVFLTHAHRDHYENIQSVLKKTESECPIYLTEETVEILKITLQGNDNRSELSDELFGRIVAVDSWCKLNDSVVMTPVSAGHAPGAVSYLFRALDPDSKDATTILATGDFTFESVAGNKGLEIPDDISVDILLVNCPTENAPPDTKTKAIKNAFEQANGGKQVLVGGKSLFALHFATLCNSILDTESVGREVTIRLVGQPAKMYKSLGYGAENIELVAEYAEPEEVMSQGSITISAPDTLQFGSTKRLYNHIADSRESTFIRLHSSNTKMKTEGCTVTSYKWFLHPDEQDILQFVRNLAPFHAIFKHANLYELRRFAEADLTGIVAWSNDDHNVHTLQNSNGMQFPEWISERGKETIRNDRFLTFGQQQRSNQIFEKLPDVTTGTQPVVAEDEGINIEQIKPHLRTRSHPPTNGGKTKYSIHVGTEGSEEQSDTSGEVKQSSLEPELQESVSELEGKINNLLQKVDGHIERSEERFSSLEQEVNSLETKVEKEPQPNPEVETDRKASQKKTKYGSPLTSRSESTGRDNSTVTGIFTQNRKGTFIKIQNAEELPENVKDGDEISLEIKQREQTPISGD